MTTRGVFNSIDNAIWMTELTARTPRLYAELLGTLRAAYQDDPALIA